MPNLTKHNVKMLSQMDRHNCLLCYCIKLIFLLDLFIMHQVSMNLVYGQSCTLFRWFLADYLLLKICAQTLKYMSIQPRNYIAQTCTLRPITNFRFKGFF